MEFLDFLFLMKNSKIVLTDSGGIQEETSLIGIPCITLENDNRKTNFFKRKNKYYNWLQLFKN